MKLAIITARGGSKRIPRKNIRDFIGKPIIEYSIEVALASNLFDEVIVSTDDDEIAEVALKNGAKVPFKRSQETSSDFATTNDVISEVLGVYNNQGKEFDYVCCIYPTAVFLTPELLHEAYHILSKKEFDVVLPIVAYSFPIQRSFKIEDKCLTFAFPNFSNSRSQDLEKHFHDAGQFYFFDAKQYKRRNTLISDKMYGIELNEMEVQDIDTEIDWKLAELKYSLAKQNRI
jgi:pseudaminic acid cytidylyltransferase